MIRNAVRVTVLLSALIAASPAWASPIVGTTANTIPKGTFMLDTWISGKSYTRSYDDGWGGWIDLPDSSEISAMTLSPRLYYGVTDWLTMRVAFPIEYRFTKIALEDGEDANVGPGDLLLEPKFQFYRTRDGATKASFLATLRLPTGDTEGKPALSDGSTDWAVGVVVSQQMESLAGHAAVIFTMNGENENGVDAKDFWVASASIEVPIGEGWSLLWEAKGYAGEAPLEYYRLYACPGICWTGEKVTAGLSAMISTVAQGGGGVSWLDYEWAPYFKIYYRFF
jgi:hypothetical protein